MCLALLGATTACGPRPAPAEGIQRSAERADVGVYTGGWPDGAAASSDAAQSSSVEPAPEAGEAGSGVSEGFVPEVGRLQGVAEETRSYCGGAPPSQQLLDQLRTPQPVAGLVLLLRAGAENDPSAPVLAEATTDERGHFAFAVEPGTYCIVEEAKRAMPESFDASWGAPDPECLAEWLRTCDSTFLVGADPIPQLLLQFARGCRENPCLPAIPYP